MACPWTVHEFWPVHDGQFACPWTAVHGLLLNIYGLRDWGWTGHGQSMDKSKNLAGAYTKASSPQKVMDSPWTVHGVHGVHGCPAEYVGEY